MRRGTSRSRFFFAVHSPLKRRCRLKKNEELTVITKTYDLILWTVNHTSRFPRNDPLTRSASDLALGLVHNSAMTL